MPLLSPLSTAGRSAPASSPPLTAGRPPPSHPLFPHFVSLKRRKLEFHFTPKHASRLNMAEIESGVLGGQCLARRISDYAQLEVQVEAWTKLRNAAGPRINWMFDVRDAREKFGRSYPIAFHAYPAAAA